MISAVGWGALLIIGVLLLFYLLTWITKYQNNLTTEHVETIIQKHLDQNAGPWDWDDFTSLPIRDEYLDRIRLRCLELDSVPSFERIPEHQRILQELRRRRSDHR
jgi:hypothetical protein